jgi:hypothetical protein
VTRCVLIVLLLGGCGDDGGPVDSGPGSDSGRDAATDAGPGGDLDDCFADFAPSRYAVVQTLATADGTIRIRTGSELGDRMAVGETFAFDLKRFGITRGGTTTCITELSALSYDFGHHNWDETLSATSGGDRFEVTMQYNIVGKPPAWDDQLRIYDAGSTTPREGPLPLDDDGCYSIPGGDLNACLGRMRTDG